jgi:uncharacterized protein
MDKKRLTSDHKEQVVNKLSGLLGDRGDILFAYIFGSFVLSDSFRDIDIGLFVKDEKVPASLTLELNLENEIESAVNFPVDVRIINAAPLSFIYSVLKHKIVVVDNDPSLRADFEGTIYKKYFDFQYLRREYVREIIHAPV